MHTYAELFYISEYVLTTMKQSVVLLFIKTGFLLEDHSTNSDNQRFRML